MKTVKRKRPAEPRPPPPWSLVCRYLWWRCPSPQAIFNQFDTFDSIPMHFWVTFPETCYQFFHWWLGVFKNDNITSALFSSIVLWFFSPQSTRSINLEQSKNRVSRGPWLQHLTHVRMLLLSNCSIICAQCSLLIHLCTQQTWKSY